MIWDSINGSAIRYELRFRILEQSIPEGFSIMEWMKGRSKATCCCLVMIGIVTFVGCSSSADKWQKKRPALYKATGVVKYKGEPVSGAIVLYLSTDQTARAVTDDQGRYTMSTFDEKDGAIAGTHKVIIKKNAYETRRNANDPPEERANKTIAAELLPKKYLYAETSDLKAEVVAGKENSETFELQD